MLAQFVSNLFPRPRAVDFGPLSDFWYKPVGSISSAGIIVKPENALAVGAVFACVRLLAEGLGQLDLRVCRRDDQESPDDSHWLWPAVYQKPNPWQTPLEWQEMGMVHLALRGNFVNRIVPDGRGGVQFWPLNPDRMKYEQLPDGRIKYTFTPQMAAPQVFYSGELLHVRGMTLDGVTGVSVLEYARNAVGSAIAQETHGAALFKNGGLPAFWIERPGGKWGAEAQKNFRQGWRRIHGGAENAGNPPILHDGMKLHELGLTNRDTQWIEARGFQAVEICRFFRVAPHMIGISDASPRANEEQRGIEFVSYTLGPWAVRWQQSIERDVLPEDEQKTHCVRINLDELKKGERLARFQAHNIGIQGGWLLPNEARKEERLPPIEGGDTPRFPSNMQPAGGGPDWDQQGGEPGKGKPKQEPADEEPTKREEEKAARKAEKRKTRAKLAFSHLLADCAARIAAAEIKALALRADKATDDRKRWRQWVAEVYQHHAEYIEKTLGPVCSAWREEVGSAPALSDLVARTTFGREVMLADDCDPKIALAEWKTVHYYAVLTILKTSFFGEATP